VDIVNDIASPRPATAFGVMIESHLHAGTEFTPGMTIHAVATASHHRRMHRLGLGARAEA
jgi:hypothetical protein